MQQNIINDKRMLIVPALISFILALLLLYKYSYPISWNVYYHIDMMELYSANGLVFWDYKTVAPTGRLIMYPPLFHLIFAFLSKTFNISPITLTWITQPVFSFYLIGVITYTTYKLTDTKSAILTGFLAMLTFVTFNRSVICTPATIAIGLSMLTCLYYYEAFQKNRIKYIIYSSIALALISNLHMATAILTIGVLGVYTLVLIIQKKINIKFLLVYALIFIALGLPWWIYIATKYTLIFNSIPGNNLPITLFFYKYYGIIPTILLIIGYYKLTKEFDQKSLFLIIWTLSLIVVSQVNLIGVQTVSIRMLEVAAYPLIIVSGIGLTFLLEKIKKNTIKKIIIILIICLSILSALVYVDSYTPDLLDENDYNTTMLPEQAHLIINPVTTVYKPSIISSRFQDAKLAHDRYEIAQWFKNNTNYKIAVSEDAVMDTIIVSTSKTPVIYGGFTESIPESVVDPVHIIKNWATYNELEDLGIGYILLKENTITPDYAREIYNNTNYKICEIRNNTGSSTNETI